MAALLARYDQTFNGGQADDPDVPDVDYKLRMAMKDKDLEVGDMGIADVKTTPIDARDGLTFTYTSSDPAVAMVEQYPDVVYTCRIMAIAPGTAVITAQDSNGVEASLTVTVSGSSTATDPTPTPGTSDDEYADLKAEIVELTNEVRAENGAAPLKADDLLMQIDDQMKQLTSFTQERLYDVMGTIDAKAKEFSSVIDQKSRILQQNRKELDIHRD